MKVRLVHTLYWGGPCPGRIIFDPWPFESLPRVGETVFVGDDDTIGAEGFTVKRVYWTPEGIGSGLDPEVELGTEGINGENPENAREIIARLRSLGFDFGATHPFEREEATS